MPRPKKPARLWQRADGSWIIIDAGRQHRTGHSGESGRRAAEEALRDYLATRVPERSGPAQPNEITVGEVLALYAREVGPEIAGKATLAACVKALAPFWGGLTCDAVKGATCRAYIRQRAKPRLVERTGRAGGKWLQKAAAGPAKVRRELGVLQVALNHAVREGVLLYAPKVTLPDDSQPRERYLTRNEVARLLRHAAPHVRRFILISVLTGTRTAAVLSLRWQASLTSGWVDLGAGLLHRKGAGERETNKRRGTVSMPRNLRAHMRRWARSGGTHVVVWRGKPVADIGKAFEMAAERAGLEGVTPHDLKRTAVTWFFQRGGTREDAAEYFDTTVKTLERVYRAHSPQHQARGRAIMEGK